MNRFLSGYKTYNTKEGYGDPYSWRKEFFHTMNKDEAKAFLNEKDPYEILDISKSATKAEIKAAYRKKAMEWHPDRKGGDTNESMEMMKRINAAYSILM